MLIIALIVLSAIATSESASCQRHVCKLGEDICKKLTDKQNLFENRFKDRMYKDIVNELYDADTVINVSFYGEENPTVGRTTSEQLDVYEKIDEVYVGHGYTQLTFTPTGADAEGEFYVVEGNFKLMDDAGHEGITGTYYQKFNPAFHTVQHTFKVTEKMGRN